MLHNCVCTITIKIILSSRIVNCFSGSKTSSESLSDVAALIRNGQIQNIVVMAGAGISTASGIPDFR